MVWLDVDHVMTGVPNAPATAWRKLITHNCHGASKNGTPPPKINRSASRTVLTTRGSSFRL
jgi:hypothetical protein